LYFELEDNGGFSLALKVCMCVASLSFLLIQMKRRRKYDAKQVKRNIFLPSLDLVNWQTNFLLISKHIFLQMF